MLLAVNLMVNVFSSDGHFEGLFKVPRYDAKCGNRWTEAAAAVEGLFGLACAKFSQGRAFYRTRKIMSPGGQDDAEFGLWNSS